MTATRPTLVVRDVRIPGTPSRDAADLVIAEDRIVDVVPTGTATIDGIATIDAGGGTVLPGFVDTHVHLVLAGTTMGQVELGRCSSPTEFTRRLATRAATLPPDGPDSWVLGHGWLETDWGGEIPDSSWLADCGDRPTACFKHVHHAVLVNERVLRMLDDSGKLAQDPPGGTIVRHDDGRPTGLLLEAAAWQLVNPIVPKPSVAARRRHTIDATRHLATLGITAVGSMEYAEDMTDVLDAIRDDLAVAVAVTMLDRELPIDEPLSRLEALAADDRLRLVGAEPRRRLLARGAVAAGITH